MEETENLNNEIAANTAAGETTKSSESGMRQMPTGNAANGAQNGKSSRDGMPQGDGEMPAMNCADDESGQTNCTPPELPEGEEGTEWAMRPGGGMGMMGERPGEQFTALEASGNAWHPTYYLATGAGSVVLGLAISYACFSKFFHRRPGQTFSTLGKFLGFLGAALAIAVGLAVLCYFIPVWARG